MKNVLLGLAFITASHLFASNVSPTENKFLKKEGGNEVIINKDAKSNTLNNSVNFKAEKKPQQVEEIVMKNDEPVAQETQVVKHIEKNEQKNVPLSQEDKTIQSLEEAKKQIDALTIKGFDKDFAKNELNDIIYTIKINK